MGILNSIYQNSQRLKSVMLSSIFPWLKTQRPTPPPPPPPPANLFASFVTLIINFFKSDAGLHALILVVGMFVMIGFPLVNKKKSKQTTVTMIYRLFYPYDYYHFHGTCSYFAHVTCLYPGIRFWKDILTLPKWMREDDHSDLCGNNHVADGQAKHWYLHKPNSMPLDSIRMFLPWSEIVSRLKLHIITFSLAPPRHVALIQESMLSLEPIITLKIRKIPASADMSKFKHCVKLEQFKSKWRTLLAIATSELVPLIIVLAHLADIFLSAGYIDTSHSLVLILTLLLSVIVKLSFATNFFLSPKRVPSSVKCSSESTGGIYTCNDSWISKNCLLDIGLATPSMTRLPNKNVDRDIKRLTYIAALQHILGLYLLLRGSQYALGWIVWQMGSSMYSLLLEVLDKVDIDCFESVVAAKLLEGKDIIWDGPSMLHISATVLLAQDEVEAEEIVRSVIKQRREEAELGKAKGKHNEDIENSSEKEQIAHLSEVDEERKVGYSSVSGEEFDTMVV